MFFRQLTSSSGLIKTTTGFSLTSSSSSVIPLTKDNCGQISYTRPGSYTWICPPGVTAVSIVCIGGGGGGYNSWGNLGGGGGGLGWKNNISVAPGALYSVVVGAGGTKNGNAGGNSYFISEAIVAGYGGGNGTSGANTNGPNKNVHGGGWFGDGGGAGGTSNYGGGGAGGYTGNGGGSNLPPADNTGAACCGGFYSSTYGSGGGGGTGINGKGETGLGVWGSNWYAGSTTNNYTTSIGAGGGGAGGSGGSRGMSGENNQTGAGEGQNTGCHGGFYGGGGGTGGTCWPSNGGSGGFGAVKLIWTTVPIDANNPGRLFPSTYTADIS